MRQRSPAFPVGLYGMLLFALCWLTLPPVFAPLERWLVGATCLLPRTVARWSGDPAVAAATDVRKRREEIGEELAARTRLYDVAGARSLVSGEFEPVLCAVTEVLSDVARRGGASQPAEVRLDRSYAELAGCAEIVTKGDALLGFLQRPGVGVAADDEPGDPARVMLLHHRLARPVCGSLTLPDGEQLRLVVRPAAAVDPAPLCADLWDDPYRAARLDRSGGIVRTATFAGDAPAVPAGMLLGRTRIWGYERLGGAEALTIGVFIVPPVEPRALAHVVLWRHAAAGTVAADARELAAAKFVAATVHDLPGAVNGRHLLAAAQAVPDGAAVVQDGALLGTARGLSFGMALVTSFAASRHRWSLVLMPDGDGRPLELGGEVVHAERNVALLRWQGDPFTGESERLPEGHLFTGSNGPHCPAGLWIGTARQHDVERDLLVITTPADFGARAVQVAIAGGAP